MVDTAECARVAADIVGLMEQRYLPPCMRRPSAVCVASVAFKKKPPTQLLDALEPLMPVANQRVNYWPAAASWMVFLQFPRSLPASGLGPGGLGASSPVPSPSEVLPPSDPESPSS